MSTSGDNLDLNLSLNLPLSRMHLASDAQLPVTLRGNVRQNPFVFLSPPTDSAHTCKSTHDKFFTVNFSNGVNTQLSLDHFPHPRSVATQNHASISVIQVPKEEKAVYNFSPGAASYVVGRRGTKAKFTKHAKMNVQEAKLDSVENFNMTGCCRYDSSLGLLTKKFIKLIQEAKDGTLDLNRTADILEVQKRRIYDITNVLEGIGLIEKTTKNHIRWKGCGIYGPKALNNEVSCLKAEVAHLREEELRLDERIRDKLASLQELMSNQNHQKNLFLTVEEILSLPWLRNQTVIAIQAPRASTIEVPDPDEAFFPQDIGFCRKQYKLIVRSTTGPIGVYLMSQTEQKIKDVSVKRTKLSKPLMWVSNKRVNNEDLSSSLHSSTHQRVSGVQQIVPLDSGIDHDYWLRSDNEVRFSDLWSTEDL